MGRTKEYDRTQALSAVTDAFWEKGFAGTSMRSLIAVTGVNPKSLYAEFGDKEQMFVAAIDAYIAEQASFYQPLKVAPFGLERLREHFGRYRFGKGFRGCLLINSLAEDANIPAAAQKRIDEFFASVKKLFRLHLAAARDAGQLAEGISIPGLSDSLLVFDQGLAIAGKSDNQRPCLRAAITAFLNALSSPQGSLAGSDGTGPRVQT